MSRQIPSLLMKIRTLLIILVFSASYPVAIDGQTPNIVTNGSFESGSASLLSNPSVPYWSTNFAFQNQYAVISNTYYSSHSGSNSFAETAEAYPGTTGLGVLSQNLNTISGAQYQLTYYLGNYKLNSLLIQNEFEASIGKTILSDTKNIPYESYTLNSATFTATGDATSLDFGLLNNYGVFLLDDVSVKLDRLSLETTPGLTSNETNIAKTLDAAPLNSSVGQVALSAVSLSPSTIAANLSELSPEKLEVFRNIAVDNFGFLADQVDNHLENLRSSDDGLDYSGLETVKSGETPALSQLESRLSQNTGGTEPMNVRPETSVQPEQSENRRWSAFVFGNVVLADLSSNADTPHSNYTTGGVTAGADFHLTKQWSAGALVGYNHTDADLDNYGSKLKVDTYYPGVYLAYHGEDGWFANGLFTYDYNSYQESRQIPFLATKATAAPVGNEYNTDVDGGFEFHGKALTFGPVLALQYVHEDVNGFSESGASGADLAVQSQTVDSLRSRIGAQGRYSFQICNQVAIAPHLLATWQHEYLESSDSLHTQFANLGDAPFTVDLDKTDRDAAFVDAGADTKFNNALLMFIDYQAQAGQSNYFAQSVNGGVKVSF